MNNYKEETVLLYGDNSECFGEIDHETLRREWDYISQFKTILGPTYTTDEAREEFRQQLHPKPVLKIV